MPSGRCDLSGRGPLLSGDRRRQWRGVPVRTGIQTSPPGYETRPHSHPYVEMLTVLEGEGEAWVDGEDGVIKMEPG